MEGYGQGRQGLRPELLQVLLRLPVGRAEAAALAAPGGDLAAADEDVKRGLEEAEPRVSAGFFMVFGWF